MFTDNDWNADWDTTNAECIVLSDDMASSSGSNYYQYDGDVYLVNAGYYVLSGELSNGSIIVNADSKDKIWIMLNGVSINCEDDAAIRVEQADKVFLTLADGTENTVSSGAKYNSDVVSTGVDGVIYSRDDLTINGTGSLNVTAQYQHGIVGNDDLVITGGTITIDAVKDAVHANDSVRIANAALTISAGDDGITVSNDDETAYLYIESGTIDIESCYEGLEAVSITIAGGDISILPEDDGINANGSGTNSSLTIEDGEITIVNTDGRDADGLDSNKDITILGGTIFISVSDEGGSSAIDYGTENNGVCEISGGTILACGSSGMAEGFDSSSTQGFLMYTTSAESGTIVTLKDADGNELISQEVPCDFSSVVVSTPEMAVGDTCTIIVGENEEEVTIDNSSASFGQGGMQANAAMGAFSPQNGTEETQENEQDDAANAFEGNNSQMQMPDNSDTDGAQPQMPDNSDTDGAQPQMPDNSDTDGAQPQMPDNSDTDGAQPQMPDGAGNAEMPNDAGNAPDAAAQANGTTADMPMDGTMPDAGSAAGSMQPNGNDPQFNTQFENGSPDTSQTETTSYTVTKTDLIVLFLSIGILLLGCIIAARFPRRK
jgi:hypothetical protein